MNIAFERKDNPFLDNLVKIAHPDCTLRKGTIHVQDKVTFYGTMWSDGSRNVFSVVNLSDPSTLVRIPVEEFMATPEAQSRHSIPLNLPSGICVICWTQGAGFLTVYLHPDNVNFADVESVSLTDDEYIVLICTRKYKSSYAGVKDYRFHEARREYNITLDRWVIARQDCVVKGLLNKSGAITTLGRNSLQKGANLSLTVKG